MQCSETGPPIESSVPEAAAIGRRIKSRRSAFFGCPLYAEEASERDHGLKPFWTTQERRHHAYNACRCTNGSYAPRSRWEQAWPAASWTQALSRSSSATDAFTHTGSESATDKPQGAARAKVFSEGDAHSKAPRALLSRGLVSELIDTEPE